MSEYHLSIAEKQTGPHSQFYIIQGIREGRLRGAELVWRKGLEGWQPLRKLDDFEAYWPPTPEKLAQAEAARQVARSELDRPQPWLRFWARAVDFILFTFVMGIFIPPSAMEWVIRAHIPPEPLLLLLYVPLEAWMLSKRGSTPGKMLLRIQVRALPGGLPSFRQALLRSFWMYVKGLALAFPIISLFFMAWWKIRLMQSGTTAWDETAETRVEHGEPEGWRYVVLAGILLGVILTTLWTLHKNWAYFQSLANAA